MKKYRLSSALVASILVFSNNGYAELVSDTHSNDQELIQEPQVIEQEHLREPQAIDKGIPEYTQILYPEVKSVESCDNNAKPSRIAVRHIEAGGIGYTKGYTTLDLFFGVNAGNFLPFVDIRGHVFNDSKLAFNGGLGLRYLKSTRIYGGGVYYDYRQASVLKTANQIGVGLESLGRVWDFRANGYFPFGKTITGGGGSGNTSSSHFVGHHLILGGTGAYTMIGCSGEVGAHLGKIGNLNFYGAAGPYYFEGQGVNAYGGKGRAYVSYKDYVKVELSDSYDNVFYNNFQGQITLSIPFGPKAKISRSNSSMPACADLATLRALMSQPVIREEIIVEQSYATESIAIDPLTGLPIEFIFVNNTSHSLGTYESPYPTLAEAVDPANSAPHNVIYIYPGDGSTAGLALGNYQLQDYQQILGAGISHIIATTVGPVTIQPLAASYPQITSTESTPLLGYSVLNLANNNTISGLHLSVNGHGDTNPSTQGDPFYAIGQRSGVITNLSISNNQIVVTNNGVGINLGTSTTLQSSIAGEVNISNNIFTSPDNQASGGITLLASKNSCKVTTNDNTISGFKGRATTFDPNGPSGINFLAANDGDSLISSTFTAQKNIISDTKLSIQLQNNTATTLQSTLADNSLIRTIDAGILVLSGRPTSSTSPVPTSVSVIKNNTINGGNIGINFNSFGSSSLTITATKNNVSNCTLAGFNLLGIETSNSNYTLLDNTFTGNVNGIRGRPQNDSILSATIRGNTASDGQNGLNLFANNNGVATYTVNSNTFKNNTNVSNNGSGAFITANNTSIVILTCSDNTATANNMGLRVLSQGTASTSRITATLEKNNLNQNLNNGIDISANGFGSLTSTVTGNFTNTNGGNGIGYSTDGNSISNNTIRENQSNGNSFSGISTIYRTNSNFTTLVAGNECTANTRNGFIGDASGNLVSTSSLTVNGNNRFTESKESGLVFTSSTPSPIVCTISNNLLDKNRFNGAKFNYTNTTTAPFTLNFSNNSAQNNNLYGVNLGASNASRGTVNLTNNQLSNNTTIAGSNDTAGGSNIFAFGTANLTCNLTGNTGSSNTGAAASGAYFTAGTGGLPSSTPTITAALNNNTYNRNTQTGSISGSGIGITTQGGGTVTLTATDNTLQFNGSSALLVNSTESGIANVTASTNNCTNNLGSGASFSFANTTTGNQTINLSNNLFTNNAFNGLAINTLSSSKTTFILSGNTFSSNLQSGLLGQFSGSSNNTITVNNANVFSDNKDAGLYMQNLSNSTSTYTVSGNTLSNNLNTSQFASAGAAFLSYGTSIVTCNFNNNLSTANLGTNTAGAGFVSNGSSILTVTATGNTLTDNPGSGLYRLFNNTTSGLFTANSNTATGNLNGIEIIASGGSTTGPVTPGATGTYAVGSIGNANICSNNLLNGISISSQGRSTMSGNVGYNTANTNASHGISINSASFSTHAATVQNNTTTSNLANGIDTIFNDTSTPTLTVQNNQSTLNKVYGFSAQANLTSTTPLCTVTATGNTFSNNGTANASAGGALFVTNIASRMTCNFNGNTTSSNIGVAGFGARFVSTNTSVCTVNATGNTLNGNTNTSGNSPGTGILRNYYDGSSGLFTAKTNSASANNVGIFVTTSDLSTGTYVVGSSTTILTDGNTLNSNTDTGLLIAALGGSTLSGDVGYNTASSNGSVGSTTGVGIAIQGRTSATFGSKVHNNTANNNTSTGIETVSRESSTTGMSTGSVIVDNNTANSNGSIGLSAFAFNNSNLNFKGRGNTLTNNTTAGAVITSDRSGTTTGPAPNVCLEFANNISSNQIQYNQATTATFNLDVDSTGNTPSPTATGTIVTGGQCPN